MGERKARPVLCRKKEEAIVEVVCAAKLLQILSTIILVTAECASKSFIYLHLKLPRLIHKSDIVKYQNLCFSSLNSTNPTLYQHKINALRVFKNNEGEHLDTQTRSVLPSPKHEMSHQH